MDKITAKKNLNKCCFVYKTLHILIPMETTTTKKQGEIMKLTKNIWDNLNYKNKLEYLLENNLATLLNIKSSSPKSIIIINKLSPLKFSFNL